MVNCRMSERRDNVTSASRIVTVLPAKVTAALSRDDFRREIDGLCR